jgi:hypothetical protein
MPVPIAAAEAQNRERDCFVEGVGFEFYQVLNAFDVPVSDPAERHGRSVSFFVYSPVQAIFSIMAKETRRSLRFGSGHDRHGLDLHLAL